MKPLFRTLNGEASPEILRGAGRGSYQLGHAHRSHAQRRLWVCLPVVLISVFSIFLLSADAADWPVARGDAASSGVAKAPLAEPLSLDWKYAVTADSAIEATPVIAGGVVYVGDTEGGFHAVNLATGEAVWSKKFANAIFTSAAAVANNKVFFADIDGIIRCLSTVDGSEHWQRSVDSEVHAGPTLYGDSILVTTESGTFHRLDAATGEPKWEPFAIEAPLRCSATVIG